MSWTCRDGVYVGSAADSHGVMRPTYWVDGKAHGIPVALEDGFLLDVNEHHVAVGDGYDPALDRWRNYVYDIDSGELTWLPGIGGDYAGARRINDHGVAVGSTSRGRLTPDRRDFGGVDARMHWPDLEPVAWTPAVKNLEEAGPGAHAFDVNDDRRAVGFADVEELQQTVAAYWSLDDLRLHTMGRPVPGMAMSVALGVSEGGWATGSVEFEGEDFPLRHAFVWTGSGDLRMLPDVEGEWEPSTSNAHGVDDVRDEVAGMLGVDGTSRPTVWRCASSIGEVVG